MKKYEKISFHHGYTNGLGPTLTWSIFTEKYHSVCGPQRVSTKIWDFLRNNIEQANIFLYRR